MMLTYGNAAPGMVPPVVGGGVPPAAYGAAPPQMRGAYGAPVYHP